MRSGSERQMPWEAPDRHEDRAPFRYRRPVHNRGTGTSRREKAAPNPLLLHDDHSTIHPVHRGMKRRPFPANPLLNRRNEAICPEKQTGCRSDPVHRHWQCFAAERDSERCARNAAGAGHRDLRYRLAAHSKARRTRLPLVPPKPKEFDIAILTFAFRASFGT